MMGISEFLYDLLLAPLERYRLSSKRKQLLKNVSNNILEIGAGTGINFKHYPYHNMKKFDIIDLELTEKVTQYQFPTTLSVTRTSQSVEHLPFDDNTYDFVVFTLVFCTVSNPQKGLQEIKRVLKPDGKIIFMEHVLPIHKPWKQLFHKLTPTWVKLAHGCHLNRETLLTIEQAGFVIEQSERFLKGSFVSGIATKR